MCALDQDVDFISHHSGFLRCTRHHGTGAEQHTWKTPISRLYPVAAGNVHLTATPQQRAVPKHRRRRSAPRQPTASRQSSLRVQCQGTVGLCVLSETAVRNTVPCMQSSRFGWSSTGSDQTPVPGKAPGLATHLDGSSAEKERADEAARQAAAAEEERRRSLLRLILSEEASERLARVALVKPDRARAVEDYLLRAARFGELAPGSRVTEEQLIALLQRVHTESEHRPCVTIARRRTWSDDEDE